MKEIRVWFKDGEEMHFTEARSCLSDLGLSGEEVKRITMSDKAHAKLIRVYEAYWEMVHSVREMCKKEREEVEP